MFAPPYAIFFMTDLKEKINITLHEKRESHIWWRYIHPTIKFTVSNQKRRLFRCKYKIGRGKLMTDLCVKPTNTYQFLDPRSSHLYHFKKGIPYSQAPSLFFKTLETYYMNSICYWLLIRNIRRIYLM